MEAESCIDEAKCMLKEIEPEVQDKVHIENIRLNIGRNIVFADIYGDRFLVNWSTQRYIKKMINAVDDICKEVQKLKED